MSQAKVFDREDALRRVDNDASLYKELLAIFFEELPGTLARLAEAVKNNDGHATEHEAHALKSALGNLGAMRSYEASRDLEALGRKRISESTDTHLALLLSEIEAFRQAIADFS